MKLKRVIAEPQEHLALVEELADKIVHMVAEQRNLAFAGIRTRGAHLAERLQELVQKKLNRSIPLGFLDITLYRDDLSTLGSQPLVQQTDISFPVDDKYILLVDDVLYTGRTIRAALDELVDFGRPKAVRLVTLVDRGWREYPIQPDLTGIVVETSEKEIIKVMMKEVDGEDGILLTERG